jgi:hypothetical protein
MSVYVPDYQHDIFVSYAHVDNQIPPGVNEGWVTTLIKSLKIELGRKLGGTDIFSLWMDYELRGNSAATPETLEHLTNSATLVLILSHGYLASSWCHLELNTFLDQVNIHSGCVFVVEHDEIEERLPQLSDLRGYRFWRSDDTNKTRTLAKPQPDPKEEREYYNLVEDLGRELVDKLKQLKKSARAPSAPSQHRTPTVALQPRATIFLAEVTDDLQEQRNQVKRYLEQYNIQIVPDILYFFSGDNANEQLRQAIEADLQKSTLFVQLLSHSKPFRPPGMSTPPLQYKYAQAVADLPILQWRDPQLDLNSLTDTAQRDFLDSTQVMATSLEEFKQYLIQRLEKIEEQKQREARKKAVLSQQSSQTASIDRFVFINIVPKDKKLADEICHILDKEGIGYGIPRAGKLTPAEKRKDIENNLQICDALIILYDNSLDEWTREQLQICRKMQIDPKRQVILKIIALFNKSPEEELLLGMKLSKMQVFECATLKDNTCLPSFIQTLSL